MIVNNKKLLVFNKKKVVFFLFDVLKADDCV